MEEPEATLQSRRASLLQMRAATRWHAVATAAILAWLPLVVAAGSCQSNPGLWMLVASAASLNLAAVGGMIALRLRQPAPAPGHVCAGSTTITITVGEDHLEVPRGEVARAVVQRKDDGPVFELHLTGGDLVRMEDLSLDDAVRFIREARLPELPSVETFHFTTPAHQAVTSVFRWLACSFLWMVVWTMFATIELRDAPTEVTQAGFAVGIVLATCIVAWKALPRTLDVGAEGVVLRVGAGRTFLPYGRLTGATVAGTDASPELVVQTSARRTHRIAAAPPYEDSPRRAVAAIEARVVAWKVRAASERGGLARGGRGIEAWRAALESELGGGAAFRNASFGREALVSVVETPAAAPSQRLGAALALAGAGDDARSRVRVAVDACADDALRDAMRAALDGTLDEATVVRVERSEAERAAR